MRDYILRRLVSMVPVLFIVSIIAFGLLYVLPGDPAIAIMGENAGNRQTYLALRRELGLDQPLYMQYWSWLEKVLRGDLGKSIRTNEAVADAIFFRDYPVLQGAVLMLTGAALIANLATDLAYAYVDRGSGTDDG